MNKKDTRRLHGASPAKAVVPSTNETKSGVPAKKRGHKSSPVVTLSFLRADAQEILYLVRDRLESFSAGAAGYPAGDALVEEVLLNAESEGSRELLRPDCVLYATLLRAGVKVGARPNSRPALTEGAVTLSPAIAAHCFEVIGTMLGDRSLEPGLDGEELIRSVERAADRDANFEADFALYRALWESQQGVRNGGAS